MILGNMAAILILEFRILERERDREIDRERNRKRDRVIERKKNGERDIYRERERIPDADHFSKILDHPTKLTRAQVSLGKCIVFILVFLI